MRRVSSPQARRGAIAGAVFVVVVLVMMIPPLRWCVSACFAASVTFFICTAWLPYPDGSGLRQASDESVSVMGYAVTVEPAA
jgi:hypothetical protein